VNGASSSLGCRHGQDFKERLGCLVDVSLEFNLAARSWNASTPWIRRRTERSECLRSTEWEPNDEYACADIGG
jgi:hypothetical protein